MKKGALAIMDKKTVEKTIQFFKRLASEAKANEGADGNYNDGMCAGKAIAFNVAAEHLEELLKWEEGR